MSDRMTDDQRKKLEAALAAGLMLVYRGRAKKAMQTLSQQEATLGIPLNVREKVNAFAADRAKKVQTGINQRLSKALTALPGDATDSDKQQALGQAKSEIDHYNGTVLTAFLTSWASHQAQSDVYSASTMPDGQNAKDATEWEWQQSTDFEDDCTEAEDASPASYDELVSIAGSEPPAHPNCQCSLTPVDGTADSGATGSSIDPTTSVLDAAAAAEPAVTEDLQSITDGLGGQMAGLDYRLKSADSLARKISDTAEEQRITLSESAAQIKDALRYTMVYESPTIAADTLKALDELRAQGYEVLKVKNSWSEGSIYKGINANIRTPDGYTFELQFHTPESLNVKENEIHKLYEEFRLATTSTADKQRLYDKMVVRSGRLTPPINIEDVGILLPPVPRP